MMRLRLLALVAGMLLVVPDYLNAQQFEGPAQQSEGPAEQSESPAEQSQSPTQQSEIEQKPTRAASVLVVGGTRATGLEIVRLLKSRGRGVTVMARQTSDVSDVHALGVPVVRGDALKAEEVSAVVTPGRYDAIISTLGTRTREALRPDFEGNRNLIDAARSAGVRRFVMVTVIGAGDSSDSPPVVAKWLLKDVIALKSQAEEYLKASGLAYTIIRPGGLLDKSASGKAVLSEDPETFSWIARADLALLVVDALDDLKTVDRTYSAFDPTRERIWSLWGD